MQQDELYEGFRLDDEQMPDLDNSPTGEESDEDEELDEDELEGENPDDEDM